MQILSIEGLSDVVAWLPHGRGFIIRNKKRLESEVLPRFFKKEAKYTSFNRRLKRWNFVIQRHGHTKSAYFHPDFVRDDLESISQMTPVPQIKYGAAKLSVGGATIRAAKAIKNLKKFRSTKPDGMPVLDINDDVGSNRASFCEHEPLTMPPFTQNILTPSPNSGMTQSTTHSTTSSMPVDDHTLNAPEHSYYDHVRTIYARHQANLAQEVALASRAFENTMSTVGRLGSWSRGQHPVPMPPVMANMWAPAQEDFMARAPPGMSQVPALRNQPPQQGSFPSPQSSVAHLGAGGRYFHPAPGTSPSAGDALRIMMMHGGDNNFNSYFGQRPQGSPPV